MRATPPPVLRLPRKSCANRISLNVFQHREQMLIALDDERFVPTLVQMSAPDGFCLGVVATSVRRAEPLQCFADVTILLEGEWCQGRMVSAGENGVRYLFMPFAVFLVPASSLLIRTSRPCARSTPSCQRVSLWLPICEARQDRPLCPVR